VISPILANVYLHYVNDLWVQIWHEPVRCASPDTDEISQVPYAGYTTYLALLMLAP